MTILDAFKSLRVWGIKGLMGFIRRWPVLHRLRSSDRYVIRNPQRGVTLVGPFSSHSGIARTMRNFASMLKSAGIPFQTFDMNEKPTLPESDYLPILTPRREFDLGRYDHVVELFTPHAPQAENRSHSVLAFWEFESGMDFAFPATFCGRPLIAMSDFNARHFKSMLKGSAPVYKIRYPMIAKGQVGISTDTIRAKYGIPDRAFMVFFNFDYASSYFRKNPEAVLKAFARAFRDNDPAVLVLKTSHGESAPATSTRLKALASEFGLYGRRLVEIGGTIPQADMAGLYAACDTYVSLHRGEGFGIGMAEAMSFGKPVIATDYSSNTEFCKTNVSIPVPYVLVKPKASEIDVNAYSHVVEWADPDIDFAASALRQCMEDTNYRLRIGQSASTFVAEYFSVDNFRRDVENFLDGKEFLET